MIHPFAVKAVLVLGLAAMTLAQCAAAEEPKAQCGRPVRVVSITMYNKGLDETAKVVQREAAAGADLIVLPEVWAGSRKIYTLDDPPITVMAKIAKEYKTYIVSPIDRRDGEHVFNSSVLIDRQGKVAGIYNKVYPVMPEPSGEGGEFTPEMKGIPGADAPVFDTDFGRVGLTICFDGQFPEVWQRLADNGAQLVVFSSMYSAGRSLGAYATLHHYYIVSCGNWGECRAFDITGDELLCQKQPVNRITFDLDRRMVHLNDANNHVGNENGRIAKMLAENPGVVIDKVMQPEDWEVFKAVKPGVDVPAVLKQYGIRDLQTYLKTQHQSAAAARGGPMTAKQ